GRGRGRFRRRGESALCLARRASCARIAALRVGARPPRAPRRPALLLSLPRLLCGARGERGCLARLACPRRSRLTSRRLKLSYDANAVKRRSPLLTTPP